MTIAEYLNQIGWWGFTYEKWLILWMVVMTCK